MSAELDHFVWITADPEPDAAWLADQLGTVPEFGGRHENLGTANQLLGLGDVYLELLYPDPETGIRNAMLDQYAALTRGGLGTWAARCDDLASLHQQAQAVGLSSTGPVPLSRATPDGDLLEWQLLFVGGHEFGPLVPFFIDWGACPHPASRLPKAADIMDFHLVCEDAAGLTGLFDRLAVDVSVVQGVPAMAVRLTGDEDLPLAQPFGQFSMTGRP